VAQLPAADLSASPIGYNGVAAVAGVSVKNSTATTVPITSMSFTITGAYSTYLTVSLVESNMPVYGAGTLNTVSTTSTYPSTTLAFTIIGQSVNNTTNYYFLVATWGGTNVAGPITLTFKPTTVIASGTNTITAPTAISYTLQAGTCNWVGTTGTGGTTWTTASNWNEDRVPGLYDVVDIAVGVGTNSTPAIASGVTVNVASIALGGRFGSTSGITVNGILNVTGDITFPVDIYAGLPNPFNFTGTGSVSAVNMSIYANYDINETNSTNELQIVTFSGPALTLSGNLNLTSEAYKPLAGTTTYQQVATFDLTAGSAEIDGAITTNNTVDGTTTYPTSTVEVIPTTTATLELDGTAALSGLSANGTNVLDVNNTGVTVNYNGTVGQTIYTASTAHVQDAATGGATGVDYYNLNLSGTGTATAAVGTINVAGAFTTSATTVNMAAAVTNLNVTGLSKQTAGTWTLGSGTFTAAGTSATNGLEFSGGTFNGGSAPLTTVSNNCTLDAGTETVNFGSSTTKIGESLTQNGGILNFGSGAATIANAAQINAGTMNGSTGTIGITGALQEEGGNINCGTGALTIGTTFQLFAGKFTGDLTAAGSVIVGGTFTNNKTYIPANPGTFNPGIGTVTFKSGSGTAALPDYDNESTFTYAAGTIIFSGAAPFLKDGSTGTEFNNVTFSGTGTATMVLGTGNFSVADVGTLTMTSPAKLVAGATGVGNAGYLTLNSDATSTASVAKIVSPSTSTISGNVNVQRFITGGAGYRGYRLFGSPVNVNASVAFATTQMYMGLSYIGTTTGGNLGALTGGPTGGGFTYSMNNPSLYLYDETRASSATSYVSGRNVGVAAITGNVGVTPYSISYFTTTGTAVAGYKIPAGSAYLMYFIGNTGHTTVTNTTPEPVTTTAVGYLNQGTIPVYFGKFGTTSSISTSIPDVNNGYNQVGNPYASTISLDQVAADNNSVSTNFYEISAPGGTYVAYKSPGAGSDVRASKYIVSGQGFIIQYVSGGTGTFAFNEDQKVPYPTTMTTTTGTTANGTFLLDQPYNPSATVVPDAQTVPQTATTLAVQDSVVLTGLHLQLTKDTANYTQTGIYFNATNTDAYKIGEDAIDLDGTAPVVYLSSYSTDGTRLAINELSPYTKGKRIKLYAKATSSGLYHISLYDIFNIDTTNYNVFLVDNNQKDSLDIVHYKSYAFNINNADTTTFGANRFVLVIEPHPMPPYQLVTFAGQKASEGVLLNWVTYNEGDFTGFVLQKLTGGKYVSLDSLQSTAVSKYGYTDINPITGSNTYRLKQSDFYGNITYSAPVTIIYGITPGSGDFVIYPNPSRAMITVNAGAVASPTVAVPNYVYSIYNMSGTLVGQKSVNRNIWTEDLSNYKAGMYIIVLKDSNGKLIGKSKFVKTN